MPASPRRAASEPEGETASSASSAAALPMENSPHPHPTPPPPHPTPTHPHTHPHTHPTPTPTPTPSSSASWQLVQQEDSQEPVASSSIAGSTSSFQFMHPSSTPPRPSLLPLPWRSPSVCLRFNSPFQLGHRERQPTLARCLPRPEFGAPLASPKHHPPRSQETVQFPAAKAMPTFKSAIRRVHRRYRHPSPRQRRAHCRSSPRLHLGSSLPRLGNYSHPHRA